MFQNQLGYPYSWKVLCFTLYLRAISKHKPRWGLYLEGQFNRGFFGLRVGGLIHGRAYFQNFTVCQRGLHLHERKKIVRKKDSADKLPSCCKQTSEHPKNLSQP